MLIVALAGIVQGTQRGGSHKCTSDLATVFQEDEQVRLGMEEDSRLLTVDPEDMTGDQIQDRRRELLDVPYACSTAVSEYLHADMQIYHRLSSILVKKKGDSS